MTDKKDEKEAEKIKEEPVVEADKDADAEGEPENCDGCCSCCHQHE
jgi:hypothetical protein